MPKARVLIWHPRKGDTDEIRILIEKRNAAASSKFFGFHAGDHPGIAPACDGHGWTYRSSLPACLEIVNRQIAALSQCKADAFHDDIVDFAALLEGGLA
jgi:hypothetical protein